MLAICDKAQSVLVGCQVGIRSKTEYPFQSLRQHGCSARTSAMSPFLSTTQAGISPGRHQFLIGKLPFRSSCQPIAGWTETATFPRLHRQADGPNDLKRPGLALEPLVLDARSGRSV